MDPCGASEWPWIINTHTYGKTHKKTGAYLKKKKKTTHKFHDRRWTKKKTRKRCEERHTKDPQWHKSTNIARATRLCASLRSMPNFTPACRLVTDFTHEEMCKKKKKKQSNIQKFTAKKPPRKQEYIRSQSLQTSQTEEQDKCGVRRKMKRQMAAVLPVTHMAQVDEEAVRLCAKRLSRRPCEWKTWLVNGSRHSHKSKKAQIRRGRVRNVT